MPGSGQQVEAWATRPLCQGETPGGRTGKTLTESGHRGSGGRRQAGSASPGGWSAGWWAKGQNQALGPQPVSGFEEEKRPPRRSGGHPFQRRERSAPQVRPDKGHWADLPA